MIHPVPVVTAVVFVGWFVLLMFSLMFRGLDRTPGCASLSFIALAAVVATILALRF